MESVASTTWSPFWLVHQGCSFHCEVVRSSAKFREAFVAHGTVCWPGGIDIDPELLYQQSIPELKMESLSIGVEKGPIDVSDEQPSPFDAEWGSKNGLRTVMTSGTADSMA